MHLMSVSTEPGWQIGQKWDKSGTFLHPILEHFGLARLSEKVLNFSHLRPKSDIHGVGFCNIGQGCQIWGQNQIGHKWGKFGTFLCDKILISLTYARLVIGHGQLLELTSPWLTRFGTKSPWFIFSLQLESLLFRAHRAKLHWSQKII